MSSEDEDERRLYQDECLLGLYSRIPNKEGLRFLRNALERKPNKSVSSDTLIELAELVLQNNYFEFIELYP